MSSRSESLTAPLGRRRARFGGIGPWQGAILVGLLVLAAAGGYALFTRLVGDGRRPAPTFTEATVGRQTVTSFVNASGTVATTRQVKISPYAGGRITRLAVKQGDSVVEGQEVAVMDTVPLELKRDTTRSQLEAARIRLQALLNGNTVADIATQQQAVATAQAALTRAQSDYSNLFTAVNADDIAAAQASLDRAKAALDVAQTNYDKLSNGVDLTLRPEWSALQTAKNDYQTAVSNYNNRTAAPQAYEVAAARAAVASGQSAVTAAEAKLAQVQTPNPSDVSSARSAVASAEAQLESARQKYAGLVIGGNLAERQAAQASLDAAQLALAAAERRGATGTTDADLSNAQAAIARARADVQTAQNNLNRISGQPSGVDLTAAEQGVQAAQTALTTARNNLDKLLNPLPADIASAQQAVVAAQSSLSTAQSNLDKLLQGPTVDDVAQLQAAVTRAKTALDTAQTNWDRIVNRVDLDQRTEATALQQARSDYQTALTNYLNKSAGPKAADVQTALANIDSARVAVDAAHARLAQTIAGPLPTDINQQQEAVNQLELALKSAQNDLDNAFIRAPFTGTVVTVGVNEGDQVTAASSIATLLDPGLIKVDATLDEANVARVRPGLPALLTFDAIPGRTFNGQVAVVTPSGVSQQGVVTFPVTIVFNAQGAVIPAGLTATVRIVAERKENVITVPSRALKRSGRDVSVDVIGADGKTEARPVQVGLQGDQGVVEITSGLAENEKIAIPIQQRAGATPAAFGAGGAPGLGGGSGGATPVRR